MPGPEQGGQAGAWQRVDHSDRVRPPRHARGAQRAMAPKRRPGGAPRFCSECGSAQKGPWVKACHGCGRVFREDNPPKLHYELHSGRNRFWCGGRCLTAPSLTLFYANVFLTVTVSTLWFVFDAAYLWEQVSPVLVIYVALLVAFSLSSLFFAGTTRVARSLTRCDSRRCNMHNPAGGPTTRDPRATSCRLQRVPAATLTVGNVPRTFLLVARTRSFHRSGDRPPRGGRRNSRRS